MNRVVNHLRANVVAYLALFVALGGTSYAAANLPANSVGAQQLQNHSITPVKFNWQYISGSVRAWARVDADGRLLAASTRARAIGPIDVPGNFRVDWAASPSSRCAALVSVDGSSLNDDLLGFALAEVAKPRGDHLVVSVQTYGTTGARTSLPFDVAVLC